jgi:hypothetical protein
MFNSPRGGRPQERYRPDHNPSAHAKKIQYFPAPFLVRTIKGII